MSKTLLGFIFASLLSVSFLAKADTYNIDPTHSFINVKVQHLGYSWLNARFNELSGSFSYDPKEPNKSQVNIEVDTSSFDSNHAKRDKHIRSDDFLNTSKHPIATFKSTSFKMNQDGTGTLVGDLTFMGKTNPITVAVKRIGGGDDPWGGYRQGFEGKVELNPSEFGLDLGKKLGAASSTAMLLIDIEGVRQKS